MKITIPPLAEVQQEVPDIVVTDARRIQDVDNDVIVYLDTTGAWSVLGKVHGTVPINIALRQMGYSIAKTEGATDPSAHDDLLEVCKEYLRIYCDSDMRPEDECAELYSRVKAAIAKATKP